MVDFFRKSIQLSSLSTRSHTVNLDYQLHQPPNARETGRPLLILHGLFGSKRNWQTLAKSLSHSLESPVYALDLRNHGNSPHISGMTYKEMAQDVLEFIDKHGLERTTVLGHSMGGKVAMSLALDPYLDTHGNILENLVVVDIAPLQGEISTQFQNYVKAMKEIENQRLKTRKEAADFLTAYEEDPSIRAFLLTNLETSTADRPYVKFRVPIDIIGDAVPDIGLFPYSPGERAWEGRTLFVKGAKSAYINHHGMPLMQSFFPNHTIKTLDTGHWVHAERPDEFKRLVIDFASRPAARL